MTTTRSRRRSLSAADRWRAMVEAEHAQSERARGPAPLPEDPWATLAERFREDPRRPMDPPLQRLSELISPQDTVLDVGAGAGRLVLPLALRCRQVIALEPSPSMMASLKETAARSGIHNVTAVQSPWETAEVATADAVLCVNVLYTVPDVDAFIRKLETHARQQVLIILHMEHPQAQAYPFWRRAHGEDRLGPPALRELMEVLWGMGIFPNLEMLPPSRPRGFESRDAARAQLRNRLYLAPGSPKERLLDQALDELLEEVDGVLRIRGAALTRPGLVSWRPGPPSPP